MILLFSLYVSFIDRPECSSIFGVNVSLLALVVFCFALPTTILIASFYTFAIGCISLKEGVFPPSGIPTWHNQVQRGFKAKGIAIVGIMFPIFAFFIVSLGYNSFISILDGHDMWQLNKGLGEKCTQNITKRSS
jgi:hypothetical protein